MDFEFKNSLPIWRQLLTKLEERIVTGEYPAGSHFPTVRELAAEAGVNPNTMQRAMAQLEAEGLVITNRTSGRVVTSDTAAIENVRVELAKARMEDFISDMQALGFDFAQTLAMMQEEMLWILK